MKNRLMNAFIGDETQSEQAARTEEAPSVQSRKRGRKPKSVDTARKTRAATITIFEDDIIYCRLRAKQLKESDPSLNSISGFLGMLIEQDKKDYPRLWEKAKAILELENS